MKIRNVLWVGIIAASLSSLGLASDVIDQRDSSAVTSAVKASKGAMIRVPINDAGQELLSGAELRLLSETMSKDEASNMPQAWEAGVDVTKSPMADSSTSADVSTHGHFWGWNAWRWSNVGWYTPYYYAGYWPSYYYGGYTYSYGSPYYYNYYYPSYFDNNPYWGYRYYYYPASW